MRIFLILIFFCFPSFGYEVVPSSFVQKVSLKDMKINSFLDEIDVSNNLAKKLFSENEIINFE